MGNAMAVLGAVSALLAAYGNLGHLLFTVWAISEQLDTGWGYGTNMEMAVLLPWTIELLCVPVLILGSVYFLLTRKRPTSRLLRNCCAVLDILLLLQIGLFNLFVHM